VPVNVAFIANYEKTICLHGIATRLRADGHELSWISPSRHWARWLEAQGTPREAILDLSRWGEEWNRGETSDVDRARLATIEDRSDLRVNDVILMDRLLRTRPYAIAFAHLAVVAREVENFVTARRLRHVFAEQTFGSEIVTGMTCKSLGIELLAPHVVRVPSGRMGLFRGFLQDELVPTRQVTAGDHDEARSFLAGYRRDRPKPDYFLRNTKPPLPKPAWPSKLWKHVRLELEDPHDETHFSPRWLVRQRSLEVINAAVHRISNPYWVPPERPARPFVLFPLHRQPEASIDVIGARFSNQAELVRALARTLPSTHDLYVKEHPNGLGDRSPSWLRTLRAIPGVRLVDPQVSTFALLDQAALTLAISGTAVYEAALLGRPAASIVPMFFSSILAAPTFNPFADSLADVLRTAVPVGDDQLVRFLAGVLAWSFPGFVDNPLFSPQVLEPRNLDDVAAGLRGFLAAGAS